MDCLIKLFAIAKQLQKSEKVTLFLGSHRNLLQSKYVKEFLPCMWTTITILFWITYYTVVSVGDTKSTYI